MREQIIFKTMTKNWHTVNRRNVSQFQTAGPAIRNALAPTVERRTGGTRRWLNDEERRTLRVMNRSTRHVGQSSEQSEVFWLP